MRAAAGGTPVPQRIVNGCVRAENADGMDAELTGTRVLVTGASGGIGSATARALASEGSMVAIHFHTGRERAETLRTEVGGSSIVVGADLREEGEVEAMYADVVRSFSRLDAVVVNAGFWRSEERTLHRMTVDEWQETISADLTSAFLTCRGFLAHLADDPRESASIVLVGSTAALFGEAGHADYAAAKAGMVYGLMRSLKNEIVGLAPRGRVNCVCPGWTDTPMAVTEGESGAGFDRAMATMALRKIAEPGDVASAIVFLTSDRLAGHISGAILPVSGGMEGRLLHA